MAITRRKNKKLYDSRAAIFALCLPLLAICALVITGCGEEQEPGVYKPFYFPYEDLTDGLVYEYQSVTGDSITTEYWFYKSLKVEDNWQLTGNYYDQFFQVRQFFREEIYTSGTIMADYFLYQPDSSGKVTRYDAELKVANGFPFSLKDTNSVLLFELSWTFSENPLHKLSLVRNRQYREMMQFSFKGEKMPAVAFDLRELIDDEQEGHLEQEYTGMEVYAKGLGLVYYRKDIGENLTVQFQLKDRYTMAEFEEKFKETIL